MPAITAIIYVCYIKVAKNNICGICWLVLLCFFSRPYIPAVCPAPDGRCFAGRVRLLCRQQLLCKASAVRHRSACTEPGAASQLVLCLCRGSLWEGRGSRCVCPTIRAGGWGSSSREGPMWHPQTSPLGPPWPASPYKQKQPSKVGKWLEPQLHNGHTGSLV